MYARLFLMLAFFALPYAQAQSPYKFSGVTLVLSEDFHANWPKVQPLKVSPSHPSTMINVRPNGTTVSVDALFGKEPFLIHVQAKEKIRVLYSETINREAIEDQSGSHSEGFVVSATQKKVTANSQGGEAWISISLPKAKKLFIRAESTELVGVKFEVSKAKDPELGIFNGTLESQQWENMEPLTRP